MGAHDFGPPRVQPQATNRLVEGRPAGYICAKRAREARVRGEELGPASPARPPATHAALVQNTTSGSWMLFRSIMPAVWLQGICAEQLSGAQEGESPVPHPRQVGGPFSGGPPP